MSTQTQAPARPRRLLLVGRRGAALLTQAPSESTPGVMHEITIPLDPTRPITCGPTCKARGQHWHQKAGAALRDEYLAIRAVQAGLSLRTLRQTAYDCHPDVLREPWAGAVTLTWLATQASLEERQALRKMEAA